MIIRNWPLIDIPKNGHWLFLGQIGMVVNAFLRRGKLGWWAVKGKIEAGQSSIKMWHRRAAIQTKRSNWLRIKKLMILKWRP